jgi:hypothetical protein
LNCQNWLEFGPKSAFKSAKNQPNQPKIIPKSFQNLYQTIPKLALKMGTKLKQNLSKISFEINPKSVQNWLRMAQKFV